MPIRKLTRQLPPVRGGVNDVSNLLSLKANEAHAIYNMHLDHEGMARTRRGSRLLSTFDDPVSCIFDYHMVIAGEPSSELLVVAGSKWFKVNYATGVETEIHTLSTDTKPTIVAFNNGSGTMVAILANGTDFLMYDGTTVSNVTSGFQSASNPRYLLVYDNRLFATGCATDPYVVWVSAIEDPTTWGANDYFSQGNQGGDRYIGLGVLGPYALLFKKFQVEYVTEGNPQSDTVQHLVSSRQYGISSHWSYVTEGEVGYFVDESGIYVAYRESSQGTVRVEQIHEKVKNTFSQITQFDTIHAGYDPNRNEIMWGLQETGKDHPNVALVLNTKLTKLDYYQGWKIIWGGRFEGDGYVPSVFGNYVDSTGKILLLRADDVDSLYVMDEDSQYKDGSEDVVAKIYTGAIAPYGLSGRCTFRGVTPSLWQKNDGSTNMAWVTDASYHGSDITALVWNNVLVSLTGDVPVWNEGNQASYLQVWGSTIWAENAVIPVTLDINVVGHYIEFMIWCDGTNADDEFEYGGLEFSFQPKGKR